MLRERRRRGQEAVAVQGKVVQGGQARRHRQPQKLQGRRDRSVALHSDGQEGEVIMRKVTCGTAAPSRGRLHITPDGECGAGCPRIAGRFFGLSVTGEQP